MKLSILICSVLQRADQLQHLLQRHIKDGKITCRTEADRRVFEVEGVFDLMPIVVPGAHRPDGGGGGGRGTGSKTRDRRGVDTLEKVLDNSCMGLPTELPQPEAARPDPQGEFWDTGPPNDEHCQVPAWNEFDQRLAESEVE